MRQHLALLFGTGIFVGALGGCSLIYNPSNLPPIDKDGGMDAPVDAELILDADPSMLTLTGVSPTTIFEGDGVDGSRPAVLVIHGMQIVDGATVTLTEHGTTNAIASLAVDPAKLGISANGFDLAVPVTAAIDANDAPIGVDITVTQMTAMGMVSKTLPENLADPALLTLQGMPELTGAPVLAAGAHEYARINVSALGTMAGVVPLELHSRSSVTIAGALTANATGQNGGAGGSNGPAGGNALAQGAMGNGPAGGINSGGGGGFGTPGAMGTSGAASATAGDEAIKMLAGNKGSSGASGKGGALGAGGAAGGSGGSLVVTAGGTMTVGAAQAIGGNAGNPSCLGCDAGGGGSGGLVLLRAGGPMTATAVDVSGGTGKTGGIVGKGGIGRVRLDAPNGDTMTTLSGATTAYRGPMFAADTVLITRNDHVPLTVTGQKNASFRYYFTGEDGSVRGPRTVSIADSGQNNFPLEDPLFRGLNKVCLLVADAALGAPDEAQNCISIAYLYTP